MLKIAKFINMYGMAIIVILAVTVTVFTASIFYFYTFSAFRANDIINQDDILPVKILLEQAAIDLSSRQTNLERLRSAPLELRNVFK